MGIRLIAAWAMYQAVQQCLYFAELHLQLSSSSGTSGTYFKPERFLLYAVGQGIIGLVLLTNADAITRLVYRITPENDSSDESP